MDQDAFRSILTSSSSRPAGQSSRYGKKQPKTISASEPAFKPRKVKKDAKYRDRAAERRVGDDHDYAQVEALLEDFKEKTANEDQEAVDEQRRYLGGDSEHTILVKGLDFALLEQNKAKAAISATADEDLEEAFAEVPKKRTREDIVRELKEKRAKEAGPSTDAPIQGNTKFKPIGFKPIGGDEGAKKKKNKKAKAGDGDVDGKKKRKKKKVEVTPSAPVEAAANPQVSSLPQATTEPETESPEDVDIFEGAGYYQGLDDGDEDDISEDDSPRRDDNSSRQDAPLLAPPSRPGNWFDERSPSPGPSSSQVRQLSPPRVPLPTDDDGEGEEEVPMRLVPLQSSLVPSIKDLLALDRAAGSADKKRKRKDKTKGKPEDVDEGKKVQISAEERAERDYKRLKTYQDKKAASSK